MKTKAKPKKEARRLNESPRWSGLLRCVDFNMRGGEVTVYVGCKEYTPAPVLKTVPDDMILNYFSMSERHVKEISPNVWVVDQWIIGDVLDKAL
jgi:hypothetical protein